MRNVAQCGTYGGYQRHLKRGEEPCRPCRDGAVRYRQEYRSRPEAYARELAYNATRGRALQRLAELHQQEFLDILSEERASVYAPGGAP